MKKALLVVLFAILAMSIAMAQSFVPTTDTLGAHNDGGRGCAGCHAPHSGGRGAGGNVTGTGTAAGGGVAEGDKALWGTDLYPITSQTILTGDAGGFNAGLGTVQELTATSSPLISGIAVCLSCHDGNVSTGAMMMGQSYEQAASLLPTGHGTGATTGALYGSANIPTLLGNDGSGTGDYANDHPIGPSATITAVASSAGANLTYTLSANGTGNSVTWTTAGNYALFVTDYGMPAVASASVDGTNRVPYVVCTTCHNQHIMNVYKSGSGTKAIAGLPSGSTSPTYFFINGPYNPGSAWTTTKAPSTTQFCRQCHFSHANEYYGVTTVTTAF